MATDRHEDDVDLAAWLLVPLRRWRWTFGFALLGLAGAFVFQRIEPVVYQARATVSIAPPRTVPPILSGDETVNLTTDEMRALQTNLRLWLSETERQEGVIRCRMLAALAQGAQIEDRVREALGPRLSAEEKQPGAIAGMVETTAIEEKEADRGKATLVSILATGRDPARAAEVANAWAEGYVALAGASQGMSAESLKAVHQEVLDRTKQVEADQTALLQQKARTIQATRALEEKEQPLKALRASRIEELRDDVERRTRAGRLLVCARALREEKQKGGSLETAVPALMQLKAEVYSGGGSSGKGPFDLHVDSPHGLSAAEYERDLDALIAGIEEEVAELDARVKAGGEEAEKDSPLAAQIARAEKDAQEAGQRVEAEKAREQDLEEAGARAKLSLAALERVEDSGRRPLGEVLFEARAAVPVRPVTPSLTQRLQVGALVGLAIGCVAAFLAHFGAAKAK